MTIEELAERYYCIAERMRSLPDCSEKLLLLGADYSYVASLLAPNEWSSPHLDLVVSQLRRNLNRSSEYDYSEKRNKTLHVMAETIERIEEENWSIMDEYFNYRDYPGGF